ncbi:MAG: MarR family transcriptional regulator [Reyranella sp.]|uniref:MarR family transcriptional regulator n=1 Tax=Reyranella sp. TaxID=1929291 RepID=UPI00273132CA|nr:MarR family transcriptional regulator [Reyranella sp.]MDP1965571.1 MarR family transcriptional regulator [Reyranella sp.]MDP2374007.1 MarR family transcriptional regulator [Reyranella sp.]
MSNSPEALEAAHLIDRLERLARAGEQVGRLNPAQWDALRYLARANRFSRTPAALADYLASTRGTVSRTLASLESKGYVFREPSDRDGRSVKFVLTSDGGKALKRDPLLAVATDIEQATGGDVAELLDGLRRTLRQAISRNQGRMFGACFSCRHFLANVRPSTRTSHNCALLDEPLSEADSRAICVEQEAALG